MIFQLAHKFAVDIKNKEEKENETSPVSVYVHDNLAFNGGAAEGLVSAKARSPFVYQTTTTLNVEWFGSGGDDDDDDDSKWPILGFVPGICESAETITVQNLAVACHAHRWRLCVLELEGHGLSSGNRAVSGDFDRLVDQVVQFVKQIMHINKENVGLPFVLCGTSLGGCLSAYAADVITNQEDEDMFKKDCFFGVVLIAPAVGIAPKAIPPALVVGALRILSMIVPSVGFLTPIEDPSHYACPATSKRNFSGHWPLITSKMLLDVTSTRVRHDQSTAQLTLEKVPSLLVLAGEKDNIVPLESVRDFFDKARCKDKSFAGIPKADHGLMVTPRTSKVAIQKLFDWLEARVKQR
jgi:alpha-beta hydrolase superfamily lysophospholipase